MEIIIVPIDFSFYSENAFLTAVQIASKSEAKIFCVNVVTSSLDWKNLPLKVKAKHQEIIDLEEEAKEKLDAFIKNHQVTNLTIEPIVEVGMPADVIVSMAHFHHAGLIVIGAYGKGYQQGRFIGSNLQKVIRMANCPVMAVKKVLMSSELDDMVFACLFNEASAPAFVKMKPLIKLTEAKVHFLYVNTPEKLKDNTRIQEQMKKYAEGQEDLSIHQHIYEFPEAEKGIIDFCEKNQIGWIGIASNTRKSSSSYRIGVTETVIFKSDIPVLSVKFE